MFWRRQARTDEEARATRRIFEAASADPAVDTAPPPFFMARVRAGIASAERRATAHPIGDAAWQMLPALAVIAVVLSTWTGYETVAASRERDATVAGMLTQQGELDEIVIAAVLFAGGDSEETR